MENHVKIHTNWDGMIDRLECDGDKKKSSSLNEEKSDNYTEPAYSGLLRIFALILAGIGAIGIVVHRSPCLAHRWYFIKTLNVHVYLGLAAVSLVLLLLVVVLKRKVEEIKE